MHQALYRKWRPKTFDEVCGQDPITTVLKYEIAEGRTSHAYLFCGSRGTGKTSCAKILAKAVNCLHPENGNPCGRCEACLSIDSGTATDVIEMDAASNNGVDNIRDIRDQVIYPPADLTYRVYIVDEVHMLSASAFNALLKTLEEPPAHVIFVLATTELHKLPATIVSRCQRFDFKRIPTAVIRSRLQTIAQAEQIDLDSDAASMLARLSLGGMRDAISMLELCAGTPGPVTMDTVSEAVGVSTREQVLKLVRAIADHDLGGAFDAIANVSTSSVDLAVYWQSLLDCYRDLLVLKTNRNAAAYLELLPQEEEEYRGLLNAFPIERLLSHCKILDASLVRMQQNPGNRRLDAEMSAVRLCDESLDDSTAALSARVAQLEHQISLLKVRGVSASVEAAPVPLPEIARASAPEKDPPLSSPASDKECVPVSKKKVLTPVKTWPEAVDYMHKAPAVWGFLQDAQPYFDGDGYEIRMSSQFGVMQLDNEPNKQLIAEALSLSEGCAVTQDMIRIVSSKGKTASTDDILSRI